jgi:hypothetical protein
MAAKHYLAMVAGQISEIIALVVSGGAGDDGKLVALDATGKLDVSVLPTGVGADTSSIVSSEALADGDIVNVWDNGGTPKVRKADWSTAGKEGHGFVLAAVLSGAAATVYFEGSNGHLTGLTAGVQYGDPATPGRCTNVAPTAAGKVVQRVGFATSATNLNFQSEVPVLLA